MRRRREGIDALYRRLHLYRDPAWLDCRPNLLGSPVKFDRIEILRLNGEFVIASRFIFADHLVEFDDHRLDIILHPGGFSSDRLVLRMRDVVFAETDVMKQSKRQIPRLHYSSVHAIFFLAGFEFQQLSIKNFFIVESQAFFHCLSSVLRKKRVLFEYARHAAHNSLNTITNESKPASNS